MGLVFCLKFINRGGWGGEEGGGGSEPPSLTGTPYANYLGSEVFFPKSVSLVLCFDGGGGGRACSSKNSRIDICLLNGSCWPWFVCIFILYILRPRGCGTQDTHSARYMYMDAKSSQGYETTEQEAAEWLLEGGIRRKTGGAKCLTPDGFFLKSSIAQGTLG